MLESLFLGKENDIVNMSLTNFCFPGAGGGQTWEHLETMSYVRWTDSKVCNLVWIQVELGMFS